MKKSYKIIIAILIALVAFVNVSRAQCPPNINFEYGSLANWQCYIGTVTNGTGTCTTDCLQGTCSPTIPTWNPSTPVSPVTNRHQITTGAGLDPIFALGPNPVNCPVVCPYIPNNTFSLKLGNSLYFDSCERVRYVVHIPTNMNYYTFMYWYAIVLENPGCNHPYNVMPRFESSAIDSATGLVINCSSSNFVCGSSMPGFAPHAIASYDTAMCKDWSSAILNFKNLAGHTIYVDFLTADCAYGGHFGYAYLDFDVCSVATVRLANCSSSACDTLLAPPGFQNYVWYDSTLTTTLGTGDTLFLCPAPVDTIRIKLAYFPYAGYGCPDTVSVTLYPPFPPKANFNFTDSLCPGFPMQFYDSSYTLSPGQFMAYWSWNFGDPNSNASNPNTSNLQNPTHIFSAVGNYNVMLVAQTNNHCKSDTIIKVVHIANKNHILASMDQNICAGTTVTLTATGFGSVPPAYLPCALNTTGGCSGGGSVNQVGSGTNTTGYSPFDNGYNNERTMLRYPATALQAALGTGVKVITALQFNITTKQSYFPFMGLTITLNCIPSSASTWGAGTQNFLSSGSVVYGPTNYSTTAGWNTFNLATPYNWDGTSDLIVEICYSSGTFSNTDVVQKTVMAANYALTGGNVSIPAGCNIPSGTSSNLLPNIKFTYCTVPLNPASYNYEWTATVPNSYSGTPFNDTLKATPLTTTTYYVNMLGTSPCIVRDTVVVNVSASFSSVHSPNRIACSGDTVHLFANSNTATITNWKWKNLHNGTFNCDTCMNTVFTVHGNDTVIVKIAMASGCLKYDTILIDTFTVLTPTFTLSKTSLCSGENVIASSTVPTAGNPITYYWNFDNPNYYSPNATNDVIIANWLNTGTAPIVKTITLQVQQNGCKSKIVSLLDTIHIIPHAHITAADTQFCAGSQITVSAVGSVLENPVNGAYVWYSSPLQSTPAVITGPGPNNITFNYPYIQSDTVYEHLQITENGCTSPWDSVMLIVHPLPFSNFTATPNPICNGGRVLFSFNGVIDSTYINAHSLTWTIPNGHPASITSTLDTASSVFYNTGNSVMNNMVSVVVTHNGCQSPPYTFPVVVNPNPDPVIVGPHDICQNQTAYLTTTLPYKIYNWTDAFNIVTHNDTLPISQSETVYLNVVDFNNCTGNGTSFNVTAHPNPVADAGTWQTIFIGNSAMLDATNSAGGDTYSWTPTSTLNNAQVVQPLATPTVTTKYTLAYSYSLTGCVDFDTVTVVVKNCNPLVIPNAFSPNGDGIDDYFMILNPNDFYQLVTFKIYDRWGQLVYSTNNKNAMGWDGNYLGVAQPVGDYFYFITIECGGGVTTQVQGDVTLVR